MQIARYSKAIAAGIGAPLTLLVTAGVFYALGWTPPFTEAEMQGAVQSLIGLAVATGLGAAGVAYRAPKNKE